MLPGVPAIIDIDGLGGLICEPCYDRGPIHALHEWIHWLRQQPRGWDIRFVNRGKGYEPMAMATKATAKGNGDQGYEPTRGKDNGGKGTAATGKGKGDQGEVQRRQTKGKGSNRANSALSRATARARAREGEGGKASTGKGNDGQGKGYKPTGRICV